MAGTTVYNGSDPTGDLRPPRRALAAGTSYTATLSGAKDLAGNRRVPGDLVVHHRRAPRLSVRAVQPDAVPVATTSTDTGSVELGVRFTTDTSGWVTGVRFYKGAGNTGVHTGSLWASDGTLLSTATFTSETASGWQQ